MDHDPTFDNLFVRNKQVPSPLCRCGLRETTYHYFFECPHLPPPSYESELASNLLPAWNDHSYTIIQVIISFALALPTSQTTMKCLQ